MHIHTIVCQPLIVEFQRNYVEIVVNYVVILWGMEA